jgi:methionine biosynthesis protein MetW
MPGPDEHARGFTQEVLDPLRYDNQTADPDEVAGIIISMIPVGSRVLDVGCGTGSITRLIRDLRDVEIIGIEPQPERARLAQERGLNVHHGYLTEELTRELGLFDIILFSDVLEHLPNSQDLLLTARRALRPSGSVVASVPNVAHWTVRLDLLRGRFDYAPLGIMDATHLRWFTEAGIRRLFQNTGYKVETVRGTAGVWMSDYQWRRPWRWLTPERRARLIKKAAKRWPTLFGCQHVVQARPALDEEPTTGRTL